MRHGEVEGNSAATGGRLRFAGWADKPLTARGEMQAQAIAQRLSTENLNAIWSSDLQRARHTAEAIAQFHSLPIGVDAALREVNYGAWEGLGLEEIERDWLDLWRARQLDAEHSAPPEGESYHDLWQRVRPAWNKIVNDKIINDGEADARIAVVAHNGTLRILLCHLLRMPIRFYKVLHTSNCGLTHLEITRRADIEYSNIEYSIDDESSHEIVLRFMNDSNHLREID